MALSRRRYSYPKTLPGGSIRLLRLPSSGAGAGPSPETLAGASGTGPGLTSELTQTQPSFILEEYKFGSEPPYRALSYTWGSAREHEGDDETGSVDPVPPNKPGRILLHGVEHEVTPNLFDALCQCSSSFPDTLLWVDALCINQDDLLERQIHVALMDKVYRNADQVILWIGLATSETPAVLDLIRAISDIDSEDMEVSRHFDHPRDFAIACSSPTVAKASNELWVEYLAFYERTWFQRGWVIQEATLARDALCLCGGETISWSALIGGSRIFLKERMRKNFFASLKKRITAADIDSLPFGRNIWRMKLIQDACSDPEYRYLLVVGLCTGSYALDSAEHILIHLMRMSRDFHWTDMRDRVYSVLGLVTYTARRLKVPPLSVDPDYSPDVTPAHVLTRAAKAVIERCKYVGIIAHVSDPSFRSLEGLPSWVPDFCKQFNYAMGHISPLDACGGIRRPDFAFSIDGDALCVHGKRLGVLQSKKNISSLLKIDWHTLSGLIDLAAQAARPEGLDRIDVLWRTMIWDIGSHEDNTELHPAAGPLGDSFMKWVLLMSRTAELPSESEVNDRKSFGISGALTPPKDDISPGLTETNDMIDVSTTIKRNLGLTGTKEADSHIMSADAGTFLGLASGPTWMQQLFLADSGYLGMGPQSGEPGDEVWVVNGCPFPMVLRREDANFRVIGRCYVHGVMHGEAVQGDVAWEDLRLR